MAWNRPSEDKAKVKVKGEQRNVHLRGLVAGALVVVGTAAAWWLLWPTGESAGETPPPRKEGLIKEVKPAVAVKTNVVSATDKVDPNARPTRVGERVNGWTKLPNGRLYKITGIVTSQTARITVIDKTFTNPNDHDLAVLLTLEPGAGMIGDSNDYYKNYNETFKETLKVPITIETEDSEEVRMLKQGVLDARAELKEHLDRGEDLTKLMRDMREQLRELSLYRKEIESQVRQILSDNNGFTRKDVEDLRSAANKMLEDRGVSPMTLSAALDWQIKKYIRDIEIKEGVGK